LLLVVCHPRMMAHFPRQCDGESDYSA
jgi:hypothetical protein